MYTFHAIILESCLVLCLWSSDLKYLFRLTWFAHGEVLSTYEDISQGAQYSTISRSSSWSRDFWVLDGLIWILNWPLHSKGSACWPTQKRKRNGQQKWLCLHITSRVLTEISILFKVWHSCITTVSNQWSQLEFYSIFSLIHILLLMVAESARGCCCCSYHALYILFFS